jgi:hypothetical protein
MNKIRKVVTAPSDQLVDFSLYPKKEMVMSRQFVRHTMESMEQQVAGNHKEPPPEKCFAKMQSKDVAHKRLSGSSKMLILKKKKIRSNKRPAWQSPYPL